MQRVILVIICLLFLVAGLLRLNEASLYTPDSSRYLIWGNSIAHGNGIVDYTLPQPDRFVIHMPLYAFMLAPVEIFFPSSFIAAKLWTLLWGMVAVIMLYFWMRKHFDGASALVGAAIFACQPLILIFSTEVLSEIPFIVWTIMILFLADRVEKPGEGHSLSFIAYCLAVGLASLVREVGAVLVMSIILFHIFRREWQRALLVGIVGLGLVTLWYYRNQVLIESPSRIANTNITQFFQHLVTASDATLTRELAVRSWMNMKSYVVLIGGMLNYPLFATHQFNYLVGEPTMLFTVFQSLFKLLSWGVVCVSTPLMILGMYRDLRNSPTALLRTLFSVLYFVLVLLFHINDVRYLLPLFPLMLFYQVGGVRWLRERRPVESSGRIITQLLLLACILLPNLVSAYQLIHANVLYQRSPARPWSAAGGWIRSNTPVDAVLASSLKEIGTVVGERKTLELTPGLESTEFELALRDNRVDYLLVAERFGDVKEFDFAMVESPRLYFEPVQRWGDLYLYKVHSRLRENIPPPSLPYRLDSLRNSSDVFRAARGELLAGRYRNASRLFELSYEENPALPEVVFQNMVAAAVANDSARALEFYGRLLMLPSNGSYVRPAHVQIDEMKQLRKSLRGHDQFEPNILMLNSAKGYWYTGYYTRASGIMNGMLEHDSSYFMGLLWGFHFAHQLHDSGHAAIYLSTLRYIDSSNVVVRVLGRIAALDDTLKHATTARRRSEIHVTLARLNGQIELREEAIDELERALGEDSGNLEALLLLASMYEARSAPFAALKYYQDAYRINPGLQVAVAKADSLRRLISNL